MPGRVLAVAALAVAGACGGGRDTVDGPDWLAGPAQPLTLETTQDDDHAVTRVITSRGGTLIATGGDGTRYRLRIPEGAVLSPVSITMTPVASVSGLPVSGGNAAAVQLEPSGLQLYRAAELTIMPRVDVPAAEQVAFAWYGTGQDAHQYPLRLDPDRIQ
ncbi:MAG TPA: hypothetical protein VHG09_13175, partial [Longimicrobiales bacterium]|nr:hypothetical protein [Longimicrobiales bacterium]